MSTSTDVERVQVTDRAVDLLEALQGGPHSLKEICEITELSKATAFRLLGGLALRGAVMKSPNGGVYMLGPGLLRLARAARGIRLVRIVGTANRGMNALRASLRRRGLGYVVGVTAFVVLLGAGGMLAFEPAGEIEGGFTSYADALWWTGMLVATMGSEFWPRTPEGRVLCFLLAVYGFAVFGYITASFASFFVGRDAASEKAEVAGSADMARLSEEIAALRREMARGS